jgi:hypothetical protein
MEAVTKSNRLVKCLKIFGGRHFNLRRGSQLTVSQNAFTEADILFTEAVKIARLVKSIYGGSQNCLSRKINLRWPSTKIDLWRGPPRKIDPFSEAGPLKGSSRLKGSRPISSPLQTLTIKGNSLSLHFSTSQPPHRAEQWSPSLSLALTNPSPSLLRSRLPDQSNSCRSLSTPLHAG